MSLVLNLYDCTRVNVPVCQKKRANEHSPFVRANELMSIRRQTNEPLVLNLFDHTCLSSVVIFVAFRQRYGTIRDTGSVAAELSHGRLQHG